MTSQEYVAILEKLQLREVVLDQLESHALRHKIEGKDLAANLEDEAHVVKNTEDFCPCITYTLTAREKDKAEILMTIKATFRVVLQAEETVSQEFFELYKTNLRVTTWPYMRELVASLTGKMGLPVLTMPYVVFQTPPVKAKTPTPKPPRARVTTKRAKPN